MSKLRPPSLQGLSALILMIGACVWSCAQGTEIIPVDQDAAGKGNSGSGGSSGSSGTGGTSGAGGSSGHEGIAGSGGTAGGAGGAGTGGTSGTGGTAGNAGGAGTGGGSAGAAGTGGGSAGAAGSAGGSPTDCHVVINELQTTSVSSAEDEFVELYNQCASNIDLSTWKLVYRSYNGTTDTTMFTWTTGTISGHAYLLLVSKLWSGSATGDVTLSGGMKDTGGGIGLRDGSGDLVDSVGWGTATNAFVEASVAEAADNGSSMARIKNGADANNNASDFKVSSPTPKASNQ